MRNNISTKFSLRYPQMIDGYVKPVTQTFNLVDKNISDSNYLAFSKSVVKILDTEDVEPLISIVDKVVE